MKKLGYAIIILSGYVVMYYAFRLPFPLWIPFLILCIPPVFLSFFKLLEKENAKSTKYPRTNKEIH